MSHSIGRGGTKRCSQATVAFACDSRIKTTQDSKLKVGPRFASWILCKVQGTTVGRYAIAENIRCSDSVGMYESNLRVVEKDGQHQSGSPVTIRRRTMGTGGRVTSKNTFVTASVPKERRDSS